MTKRDVWPMRLDDGATGIGTAKIRGGESRTWPAPRSVNKLEAPATTAKKAMQALGRLKVGELNQTEQRYAQHLEERKQAGEIAWFGFEAWKFRLADNTFYTPDFAVMLADGRLECHEVKGRWQDDARVKIKVAAYQHPVKFIAVTAKPKKAGGGWQVEEF